MTHICRQSLYSFTHAEEDTRVCACINTIFVCRTLLTGSIGSLLMEHYGWSVPFYVIGENWPFCSYKMERISAKPYRPKPNTVD